MNKYLILTRVLNKNNEMEMPDKGSKGKTYRTLGAIALSLIMIPCCIIVGFIVFVMTQALMETNGGPEGLELVIQLMSVFGIVFSVMVLFNVLYFSSDLDHLLALPIKPGHLVAAKFTHAYFAESVMEFMVLFSAFVGYFVAAKIKIVALLTAICGVVLLPLLPLVYCGIFALVAMAFFSKIRLFRNIDFMTGLVTVVFMGLFAYSFFQMDTINIDNYIGALSGGENAFLNIMGKIFFTVPIFVKAMAENNVLYLLLFILINAVAVAIMLLLGNALYLRGVHLVSTNGKSGKKAAKDAEMKYVVRNPFKSYFIKECKLLFRTHAYRKNCVLINLIWPVIVTALFIMPSTKNFANAFAGYMKQGYVLTDVIVLLFVLTISFFATAMNSIAATSFTREGAHFSFIKHAPISYKKQITAKALVSILFSGVTVAVAVIILCCFMKITIPMTIYFIVISQMSVVICTYIGIMLDATNPKFDWEDEYGALRGNLNAFFNMAIAIVTAMFLCVIGFCLYQFTKMDSDVIFVIFILIMGGVMARVITLSYRHTIKCIRQEL